MSYNEKYYNVEYSAEVWVNINDVDRIKEIIKESFDSYNRTPADDDIDSVLNEIVADVHSDYIYINEIEDLIYEAVSYRL